MSLAAPPAPLPLRKPCRGHGSSTGAGQCAGKVRWLQSPHDLNAGPTCTQDTAGARTCLEDSPCPNLHSRSFRRRKSLGLADRQARPRPALRHGLLLGGCRLGLGQRGIASVWRRGVRRSDGRVRVRIVAEGVVARLRRLVANSVLRRTYPESTLRSLLNAARRSCVGALKGTHGS